MGKKVKKGKVMRLAHHEQKVVKAVRKMMKRHEVDADAGDEIGFHLVLGVARNMGDNGETVGMGPRSTAETLYSKFSPAHEVTVLKAIAAQLRASAVFIEEEMRQIGRGHGMPEEFLEVPENMPEDTTTEMVQAIVEKELGIGGPVQ